MTQRSKSTSSWEWRRDEQGKAWRRLGEPFVRWDGREVIVATEGADLHGNLVVQRNLHIPFLEWLSWEVIW